MRSRFDDVVVDGLPPTTGVSLVGKQSLVELKQQVRGERHPLV
jgi:hypothetical protein